MVNRDNSTCQENAAVAQRPVLLAPVFPRHFEHELVLVEPLQARNRSRLQHVFQPRTQQDAVSSLVARLVHIPGRKSTETTYKKKVVQSNRLFNHQAVRLSAIIKT